MKNPGLNAIETDRFRRKALRMKAKTKKVGHDPEICLCDDCVWGRVLKVKGLFASGLKEVK